MRLPCRCSYRKPRAEDVAMPTRFGYQAVVTDFDDECDLESSHHHSDRGRGFQSQEKPLIMTAEPSDTE